MRAPRNHWYCAAFGNEIKDQPLARTLLGEPVMLYRKADGAPVAFEDRCCHRRSPLSRGKVEGDNLRCGYHGLLYQPSGAVIWAPGQDKLPAGARVRAFPVVEKHGWVWIWMGDPALADPKTAPAYDKYDHPQWASYDLLIPVKSNYFLMVDNLLDLSHLPFLHAATIGSPEDTDPHLTWERGPDWLKGVRIARGLSPPQRILVEGMNFRMDRTQNMLFEPPAHITIEILMNEYGKAWGDPSSRLNRRIVIYDFITPETDRTCHYFWAVSRDYMVDDAEQTAVGARATRAAFLEDALMLEGVQRIIDTDPAAPQIDLVGDAGGLYARRIVERLLAEEAITNAAAQ